MTSNMEDDVTDQDNTEYESTTERVEESDPREDELEADEEPGGDDAIIWSRFRDAELPALPKMAAVDRAIKAGVDAGLPIEFAVSLAHPPSTPASCDRSCDARPESTSPAVSSRRSTSTSGCPASYRCPPTTALWKGGCTPPPAPRGTLGR